MPLPNLETNDIVFMRRQFKAWIEGAEARANEFAKLSENPHPPRTVEGDAWENGWERIDYGIKTVSACRVVSSDHAFEKFGIPRGVHELPDGTMLAKD